MNRVESLLSSVVLLVALLGSTFPAAAQDPAEVNPGSVTVKVDNDEVRVLEAMLEPGEKENLHSHPACVTYVVSGGKIRIHTADGTLTDLTLTTGDVSYRGPVTHWGENIGASPIHVIIVELKNVGE